jgi:tetratricopeptide (TPR) repeat protein
MKKSILLLAGLLGLAAAPLDARWNEEIMAVFRSPAWERSFVGGFGVDPGVEPEIDRQDQALMTALGEIRPLIQSGGDSDLRQVVTILEGYVRARRAANQPPSATALQIAGTVSMRLAETVSDPGERRTRQSQAVDFLRQATEAFPNFLRAHKNLANILFRMENRRDDAKRHFIRAIELGDMDAFTFGLLGFIYFEEGKLVSAEAALRQSLMINPATFEFRQVLAQVLFNQQRFFEAEAMITELLFERPNSAELWNLQSNAFIATDRIEEAARNLEMVRMMGVADSASLRLLGDVYMNKNMVDEAAEAYVEAIRGATDLTAFRDFASSVRTLINFQAYDQATAVISAISDRFGDRLSDAQEVELLTFTSQVNLATGREAEARENLERIIRRDPFNASALITLANYYANAPIDRDLPSDQRDRIRRENDQRAILYFERAQDVDNVDFQVRAFIDHARLRVRRQELDEAQNLLESAQGLRPQSFIAEYLNQIRAANRARRAAAAAR